jgi:hypothetical protein
MVGTLRFAHPTKPACAPCVYYPSRQFVAVEQILIFRILLDFYVNQKHDPHVPRSSEGRFAIVTDVERGMRWTHRRRARVSRADERRRCGREGVWS